MVSRLVDRTIEGLFGVPVAFCANSSCWLIPAKSKSRSFDDAGCSFRGKWSVDVGRHAHGGDGLDLYLLPHPPLQRSPTKSQFLGGVVPNDGVGTCRLLWPPTYSVCLVYTASTQVLRRRGELTEDLCMNRGRFGGAIITGGEQSRRGIYSSCLHI